jgi:hypothetical protein
MISFCLKRLLLYGGKFLEVLGCNNHYGAARTDYVRDASMRGQGMGRNDKVPDVQLQA